MFERFTESARQVVVLAQDEARFLKHNYIGTEHILLGLLREEEGLAAQVLASLDITLEEMRAQVARIVGHGDELTTGQVPFTRRGKKVLELSMREALSLSHDYIDTEHILLGLVRENEGIAIQILLDFDTDAEKIRSRVIQMLSEPRPPKSRTGRPAETPLVLKVQSLTGGEWERLARTDVSAVLPGRSDFFNYLDPTKATVLIQIDLPKGASIGGVEIGQAITSALQDLGVAGIAIRYRPPERPQE